MSAAGAIIAVSDDATVRLCEDSEDKITYATLDSAKGGDLAFDTAADMRELASVLTAAADEWDKVTKTAA